jgi:hypothetical protein
MDVLTPGEAAAIARGVYLLRDTTVSAARDRDLELGCEGLFKVGDESRLIGMSGILAWKRLSGFGYIAEGEGRRAGEILVATRGTATGAPLRAFARLERFQDEHLLMGARSFGSGYGDWTVVQAGHWIFQGAGMRNGDSIPGLVGWEYHGDAADLPGLEVVASAQLNPFSRREATTGRFAATVGAERAAGPWLRPEIRSTTFSTSRPRMPIFDPAARSLSPFGPYSMTRAGFGAIQPSPPTSTRNALAIAHSYSPAHTWVIGLNVALAVTT